MEVMTAKVLSSALESVPARELINSCTQKQLRTHEHTHIHTQP